MHKSYKKLSEAAHRLGAVMVVDGAQSTPHIKVDVKELELIFSHSQAINLWDLWESGFCMGKKQF